MRLYERTGRARGPGKLIHQQRFGPLSVVGDDPFLRYYGDYATPPDFLIMLGQYLSWTNDLETVREMLPVARTTLDWLDRYGDLDGDGFIEYVTRSPQGSKNQGWKDSSQGIVDERGYIVPNPIAAVELQAWWYVGLRSATSSAATCCPRCSAASRATPTIRILAFTQQPTSRRGGRRAPS